MIFDEVQALPICNELVIQLNIACDSHEPSLISSSNITQSRYVELHSHDSFHSSPHISKQAWIKYVINHDLSSFTLFYSFMNTICE